MHKANAFAPHSNVLEKIGIFFPFLLAAILKTAQGSSTVALTTTAGMLIALSSPRSVLTDKRFPRSALSPLAQEHMIVSHANGSYFWVVANFGEMKVEDGYKTQTLGTLVIGLASMVGIAYMILS